MANETDTDTKFTQSPGKSLTSEFDRVSKEPNGETIEQLRQHYFIQATMRESDDLSVAGLNVKTSGRASGTDINKKKGRSGLDDVMMMVQNSLASIEASMAAKYGETFAENLATELLDEETYDRIMSIDDQNERRRQIALEINAGIDAGTIDPGDLARNPDYQEWLDARRADENLQMEAAKANATTDLKSTEETSDDLHQAEMRDDIESEFKNLFGNDPAPG